MPNAVLSVNVDFIVLYPSHCSKVKEKKDPSIHSVILPQTKVKLPTSADLLRRLDRRAKKYVKPLLFVGCIQYPLWLDEHMF